MTVPRKGFSTRNFSGKQFYYAGRTIYPSKAKLEALNLAERGIDVRVTRSKSMGDMIWTEKRVNLDLSEPITGRYRNPKLTQAQSKALKEYKLAVSEEDRYLGSVFVTPIGQRKVEEKTKLAYNKCKSLGLTSEHGL